MSPLVSMIGLAENLNTSQPSLWHYKLVSLLAYGIPRLEPMLTRQKHSSCIDNSPSFPSRPDVSILQFNPSGISQALICESIWDFIIDAIGPMFRARSKIIRAYYSSNFLLLILMSVNIGLGGLERGIGSKVLLGPWVPTSFTQDFAHRAEITMMCYLITESKSGFRAPCS